METVAGAPGSKRAAELSPGEDEDKHADKSNRVEDVLDAAAVEVTEESSGTETEKPSRTSTAAPGTPVGELHMESAPSAITPALGSQPTTPTGARQRQLRFNMDMDLEKAAASHNYTGEAPLAPTAN